MYKKLLVAFIVLIFSFAYAQDIALIDTQKIMLTSSVAKDLKTQTDDIAKKFETTNQKKYEDFQLESKKLVDQKATISEVEFQKKSKDLENRFNNFQQQVQKQRTDIQKSLEEAQARILNEVKKILDSYASEKKYDIVLEKVMVAYSKSDVPDVTDEIIKKLNASLPKIKLPAI